MTCEEDSSCSTLVDNSCWGSTAQHSKTDQLDRLCPTHITGRQLLYSIVNQQQASLYCQQLTSVGANSLRPMQQIIAAAGHHRSCMGLLKATRWMACRSDCSPNKCQSQHVLIATWLIFRPSSSTKSGREDASSCSCWAGTTHSTASLVVLMVVLEAWLNSSSIRKKQAPGPAMIGTKTPAAAEQQTRQQAPCPGARGHH